MYEDEPSSSGTFRSPGFRVELAPVVARVPAVHVEQNRNYVDKRSECQEDMACTRESLEAPGSWLLRGQLAAADTATRPIA